MLPKWCQNGTRRLKSDLQKLIEFLHAFWKPLCPVLDSKMEPKGTPKSPPQRSSLECPSERFSFGLGFASFFFSFGLQCWSDFVTFGPSMSPSGPDCGSVVTCDCLLFSIPKVPRTRPKLAKNMPRTTAENKCR